MLHRLGGGIVAQIMGQTLHGGTGHQAFRRIAVDAAAAELLYLQIRNQIVAGIATGQLEPGQSLPSVRSLASDLGINLHTVNKAYAVLRDEGCVRMRGRAGAVIAAPAAADRAAADASAQVKKEDDIFKLA